MSKTYDKTSIRQLKGLEAVREKIGMYLGDPTNGDALHHCIWEVVDNAVDEHLAGYCTGVVLILDKDGWAQVIDNGRGIPVGLNEDEGIDVLQMVMTSLHAGGKFDSESYAKSAGLHGIGVSAVNAVSSSCLARVRRDGREWVQEYSEGKPISGVTDITGMSALGTYEEQRGTTISWQRDTKIFRDVLEYDAVRIKRRMQELAFLNPGLALTLVDSRGKKPNETTFHYAGGIKEYVGELVGKKAAGTPVLHFIDSPQPDWNVEIAMTWTDSGDEDIRCFANNTFNADGGTHMTGFRNGLTRLISGYAKEHGLLKGLGEEGLTGADIREGVVAVVNTRLRDISFSSQTKDKLVTPDAKTKVEALFKDYVEPYFEANPGVAKKIAERAVLNARAREAARKAKEQVKRKDDFGDQLSLPGKLADCQSKNPRESEIFIVEGDSAGGSAKGGRDRKFQAILPLRGKVLNVERASIDAILDNKEIGTIITALGCGIENTRSFDVKKLRYHKIIIMTDADVDGAHIRTLLLTLFYRCMPRLIADGYVYIAQPPLFGVKHGKAMKFFLGDNQLQDYISDLAFGHMDPAAVAALDKEQFQALLNAQRKVLKITRYKGLGEMNADALWGTTMDPDARTLCRVTINDAVLAEKTFYELMGDNVEIRRAWLEENAAYAKLDI